MRRSTVSSSILLFLVGLGSCTQIFLYGCIAISEVVAFIIAPVLYVKNYVELRRLGFTTFLNMVLMLIGSMLISSWYNHTSFPFVIKSFASIYSMWAYFLVFYKLLSRNLNGLRWVFIGVFLSSIITIFALNPTAHVSEEGGAYIGSLSIEDVMEGQLFWIGRFKYLIQIPICGFYLEFPLVLSLLAPIAFVAVALATTVSGRSASISLIVSGIMMLIGRKNWFSMKSIGKYFFIYLFFGICLIIAIKQVYVIAAKSGLLSEEARNKYEQQTKQGTGVLTMLMHGRTGFFSAIPAALDRPIFGYGPYAKDTGEYALKFALKYGDEEDIALYRLAEEKSRRIGYERNLPTHSYIMGAWVHCGIGGLIFFLWVLYLIYKHIKRYIATIPSWYGFYAMMIPYYLWNIFFSPFGYRWQFALLMVCLFFSRAIGEGLLPLPKYMLEEIRKHEK